MKPLSIGLIVTSVLAAGAGAYYYFMGDGKSSGGSAPSTSNTSPNMFRVLTEDEFAAASGNPTEAMAYINDAPPPHELIQGQDLFLILTANGPAAWIPVRVKVTNIDPNGVTGYATVTVSQQIAVNSPPVGTMYTLSTKNEDGAYLDAATAGVTNWLHDRGFPAANA